jgi:hypothetical protein
MNCHHIPLSLSDAERSGRGARQRRRIIDGIFHSSLILWEEGFDCTKFTVIALNLDAGIFSLFLTLL